MHTLVDGVARRVDEIIKEFQVKNIPRISDGEIFLENAIKPFVDTVIRRSFQLEIFLERFELNFK